MSDAFSFCRKCKKKNNGCVWADYFLELLSFCCFALTCLIFPIMLGFIITSGFFGSNVIIGIFICGLLISIIGSGTINFIQKRYGEE